MKILIFLMPLAVKISAISLSDTYNVQWTVQGDRITFDVEAAATGWIGLGFNGEAGMTGADMVIGGVRDGQKYIYDMHAEGYEQPISDSKTNYELLKASENGTHTILSIRRLLDTSDKPSDYAIAGEPLYLLWAYHDTEDAATPDQFSQHSRRGSKQSNLLNPIPV